MSGKGHLDLGPIGVSEGPHVDQAGNLGLWAELIWLPAIYLCVGLYLANRAVEWAFLSTIDTKRTRQDR